VIAGADSIRFSEASIRALGLMWRKGGIRLQSRRILSVGFRAVPTTLGEILGSSELCRHHDDPFDRLLLHAGAEIRVSTAHHSGAACSEIDRAAPGL